MVLTIPITHQPYLTDGIHWPGWSLMKLLTIFNTPALKSFAFQVRRGGKEITERVTKTCF